MKTKSDPFVVPTSFGIKFDAVYLSIMIIAGYPTTIHDFEGDNF